MPLEKNQQFAILFTNFQTVCYKMITDPQIKIIDLILFSMGPTNPNILRLKLLKW